MKIVITLTTTGTIIFDDDITIKELLLSLCSVDEVYTLLKI